MRILSIHIGMWDNTYFKYKLIVNKNDYDSYLKTLDLIFQAFYEVEIPVPGIQENCIITLSHNENTTD